MPVPEEITPTQRRILEVLQDGRPHEPEELYPCLGEQSGTNMRKRLSNHIGNMKPVLRLHGMDIVAEWHHRKSRYRWVRLLANPYRE